MVCLGSAIKTPALQLQSKPAYEIHTNLLGVNYPTFKRMSTLCTVRYKI